MSHCLIILLSDLEKEQKQMRKDKVEFVKEEDILTVFRRLYVLVEHRYFERIYC